MCTCKPLPGMRTGCLSILAKRCVRTPLKTVEDTTDVSVFQEVLGGLCKKLPIALVLTVACTHVVFNQRHILEEIVKNKKNSKEEAVGALGSACEDYSCCQCARAANQVVKLLQCYLAAYRALEQTQISQSTPKFSRTGCSSMQNYWSGCAPTCDL